MFPSYILEVFKFMKEPTLERSHTSAKLVTSGLLRMETYKYMEDPTLERGHTSAKLVIRGLIKKEVY